MKILWITNILFPEANALLFGGGELRGSGGWLLASAEALANHDGIELSVATVSSHVSKLEVVKGEQITYYIIPYGKGNKRYNSDYETSWMRIKNLVNPDVIHIHGTECTHGLAYIKACGSDHVVISVQGLMSGIAPYYCAGLSWKDIYGNMTFHDIIKGSIYSTQQTFYKIGQWEKEALRKVNHIIGRTSWDKSHVWSINPKANYYVCNETLRTTFYDGSIWNYDKCIPHTIFLSQGGYPLKGLHQVLKAMPLILRHYPDTCLRIAGADITKSKGLYGILHFTGYGKIIRRLIKSLNLVDKVTFLGPLNAEQMKVEYLQSNVFICPSSIENSPNSLGEAQILGVPCIASYVGGTPDMMQGCEDYLYRFEEIEMLAKNIIDVFKISPVIDNSYIQKLAMQRHNRNKNTDQLMTIYRSVME